MRAHYVRHGPHPPPPHPWEGAHYLSGSSVLGGVPPPPSGESPWLGWGTGCPRAQGDTSVGGGVRYPNPPPHWSAAFLQALRHRVKRRGTRPPPPSPPPPPQPFEVPGFPGTPGDINFPPIFHQRFGDPIFLKVTLWTNRTNGARGHGFLLHNFSACFCTLENGTNGVRGKWVLFPTHFSACLHPLEKWGKCGYSIHRGRWHAFIIFVPCFCFLLFCAIPPLISLFHTNGSRGILAS